MAKGFALTDRVVVVGALQSMSVRLAGLALSYAAAVLMSRLLGIAAYGSYAIALSWVLVLALPAKGGFDISGLRYATIYHDRAHFSALRGFVVTAVLVVLALSALIAGLMVIVGRSTPMTDPALVIWAAALIPLLALLALFSSLMRTAQRVIASQFYDQMLRPFLVIVLLVIVVWSGQRLSATWALAISALAALASLALMLIHFRFVFSHAFQAEADFGEWRDWLTVSIPMLVMGVVQEMMNHVEVIMLGIFADGRQAGLFAASWRIAGLVPFVFYALSTLAAPLVASAYDRRSGEEITRVCKLVARVGFGFAVIASVLLFTLGPWLLGLFGKAFVPGQPVLAVLLVGGLVNAFTGVVGYLMILTGRERQALAIFACSLVASIVLNLLLIPRFSAVGAAMASSTATAAWNLAMLIYVRRTMGIDASALALRPRPSLA